MFNMKTLAILLLSIQLALVTSAEVTDEPVVILPSVPVTASISFPKKDNQQLAAADCGNATKAGLGRLLREASSLLPLRQMQQLIVDSAANDEQVSALVALTRSERVRQRVSTIKQSSEYSALREYGCKQLQLDAAKMCNFVKNFISLTKEQVKPSEGEFKGRPGIRGLFQDMRSMLPRQQLRELYQQLLKQDPQLSTAVQRIKSSEFRQLLRNVRLLPESLELREELLSVGVPLVELRELINVALGWTGDEFGDNVEKLVV